MEEITFNQVVSRGCGLDVHQKEVVATINGEGIWKVTREFGTFTSSLTELRDWLLEHGITHVAMLLEARVSYFGAYRHEVMDCQCPSCKECTGS